MHRRCQKRLRDVEAVIQSVRDGRVHPIFSQTRTDYCRVFSVKPRLLDLDDTSHVSSCIPRGVQYFCLNAKRALRTLADSASDNVLQSDLLGAKETCFVQNVPHLTMGTIFSSCLRSSPVLRTFIYVNGFSWTARLLRLHVMRLESDAQQPFAGLSNIATRLKGNALP